MGPRVNRQICMNVTTYLNNTYSYLLINPSPLVTMCHKFYLSVDHPDPAVPQEIDTAGYIHYTLLCELVQQVVQGYQCPCASHTSTAINMLLVHNS